MAKPLGAKSRLIRDAIKAHPSMGNTDLAAFINSSPARKEDGIEVKAQDVAQQKQALKNLPQGPTAAGAPASVDDEWRNMIRPPAGSPASSAAPVPTSPAAPKATKASPVDVIDGVFDLAKECGGIEQLKRLVDRLAEGR